MIVLIIAVYNLLVFNFNWNLNQCIKLEGNDNLVIFFVNSVKKKLLASRFVGGGNRGILFCPSLPQVI